MRDNVSKLGQVINGLGLPTIKTTATGVSVAVATYNAITVYINAGTYTDGTHTFLIEEAPDVAGAPGAWTTVANADLVAWKATSATDLTPVRVGNAQPAAISSAATAINQRIGYIGGKDWVRVDVTVSGAPATGCQYDAYWIEGEPRVLPAKV